MLIHTSFIFFFFFFNDTATTEIYTLSLHDALPISCTTRWATATSSTSFGLAAKSPARKPVSCLRRRPGRSIGCSARYARSEEHTSELQSRPHLVCRLLLEKKKKHT